MLASSSSVFLSFPGAIVSLLGLAAILGAGWAWFRQNFGSALQTQQDRAINALKTTIDEQDRQIKTLTAEHAADRAQLAKQAEQISFLTEQIKQTAKVDALIVLVRHGFTELGVKTLPKDC